MNQYKGLFTIWFTLAVTTCYAMEEKPEDRLDPELRELFNLGESEANSRGLGDLILNPYTPDGQLKTLDVIRRYGYPAEAHIVQTDDGHLLEMHRIPHGRNGTAADPYKLPVLMHHGLLTASSDFVFTGDKVGLAFLLADKGYDVWLANCRGNTYSRGHVTYSTKDYRFWDFSYHEMGTLDIPADIDYILAYTNRTQLSYVGHSMGTTAFYIMASERPEYNKKIAGHISLAPIAYLGRTTSLLRAIAPFAELIKAIVDPFTHGVLLSHNPFIHSLVQLFCDLNRIENFLCETLVFLITGFDYPQNELHYISNLVEQNPAGASTKTLNHYAQFILSSKFRQYDYIFSNLEHYNSIEPPAYNVSAISCKVALIRGPNDALGNEGDVKQLFAELPNADLFKVNYEAFNHYDFLIAKDARTLVYLDVLDILASFDTGEKLDCFNRKSIIAESCRGNL